MPRSESMDRAIKKYGQEKVDRVIFRVPKQNNPNLISVEEGFGLFLLLGGQHG